MSDTTITETDATSADPTDIPDLAQVAEQVEQQHADEQPQQADEQGRGSKTAVLADLAKERDARQALEAKLDAVAKIFNPDANADVDPVKVAEQAEADARQARTELAVYRAASTLGADPDALLDSAAFLRGLAEVNPTDSAAVTAAIQAAIETNPRLRLTNPAAGARDATAGNRPNTSADTEALRVLGF